MEESLRHLLQLYREAKRDLEKEMEEEKYQVCLTPFQMGIVIAMAGTKLDSTKDLPVKLKHALEDIEYAISEAMSQLIKPLPPK